MHPTLRALEEINEAESLIKVVDTTAITILKAQEAAAQRKKVVPNFFTKIVRGRSYTAS